MTSKVDLKKQLTGYSARRGRFDVLTIPPTRYLMIDGHGDPNTSAAYADALATLYPVAYKLKFFSKNELGRDYVVMPLEALWWAEDMAAFTSARDKSQWDWTAMILVPEWLDDGHVGAVTEALAAADAPPSLDQLRVEILDEGLVAQTLHIGPYDEEAEVLEALHERFIPEHDYSLTGKHHEIYLSDPRRAAPEKLRTILRQPIQALPG